MKTFFTILISALVGAGIGFYICKSNGEKSLPDIVQTSTVLTSNGGEAELNYPDQYSPAVIQAVIAKHKIDEPKLKTLIANYDDYCKVANNPRLRVKPERAGRGSDKLESFFIPKILLNQIFNHNANFNGVRLYLGKYDKKNDGVFTLALRGVMNGELKKDNTTDPKAAKAAEAAKALAQIGGPIYDYVDTCPNNCK